MSEIYSAQARYVLYYITLIGLSCEIKYNENIPCNKATFFHKHLCGFWTLLKTVKVAIFVCKKSKIELLLSLQCFLRFLLAIMKSYEQKMLSLRYTQLLHASA